MLTSFAGGSLFGTRNHDAPRVLALHGWGGDHRQLGPAIDAYPHASLDLPGFGATPPPPQAWGAEEYAEAVAPVLGEMAEPAVVVGFSFGGRIAVHLAARWPEKVQALVLTGAPLIRRPGGGAPLAFRLMKKANALGIVSDGRMEAERRKRGSADYRAATGIMRDVLVRVVNESYEEQLGRIDCPVEMVWGANDTAATVSMAQQAHRLMPSSNLVIVPGRSHFLPTEEPSAVAAAIERAMR